jgi:cleavage and polyadenylation specificity factor subunit 2
MGLPVNYTCLYGAQQDGPVCSLLDIDGFNILLDCGWTDAFDLQHIQPLLE